MRFYNILTLTFHVSFTSCSWSTLCTDLNRSHWKRRTWELNVNEVLLISTPTRRLFGVSQHTVDYYYANEAHFNIFACVFPADVSTSREASVRERPSPPINTSGRRGLLPLPSSPRAWECQLLCNSVLHTHCMLVILLHTCMHINVEST